MNKKTEKRVMAGSSIVLPTNSTGRSTKAQRIRQRATREEISENHGASKRVKETVETCIETFEQHMGCDGVPTDNYVVPNGVLYDNCGGAANVGNVLDANYTEVTETEQTSDTELKVLPLKTESVTVLNPHDEFLKLKKEMQLKAKELLKDCVTSEDNSDSEMMTPIGTQMLSYACEKESFTNGPYSMRSERTSKEYLVNPLYNQDVDFSMFSDVKKYEDEMNLNGKSVVEIIVAYANSKMSKSIQEKYRHLLTYILLVQKKNGIVLQPGVIGSEFLNRFERYLFGMVAPSTAEALVCNLKAVMLWAKSYGVKTGKQLDNWKYKEFALKPKIALSPEEISKIYYFDIDKLQVSSRKKEIFKLVRDNFVLSCFLGQRYSDNKRITEKNFRVGSSEIFEITQQKTNAQATLDFNVIYNGCPLYVVTTQYPCHE